MGRRKINILIAAFLFVGAASRAQSQYRLFDLQNPEYSRIHFGILLQYNQPWYHIVKSDAFIQSDNFLVINPKNGAGISLGILVEWNISKYVQIRSNVAQLVLDYRNVEFHQLRPGFREAPIENKLVEAPYLQWPLIVKLQSDKISDFFRVYMMVGAMVNIDVGDDNLKRVSSLIISNNDLGFLGGIGFHLYFPSVTISPQLQFSVGLQNALSPDTQSKFNANIAEIYNRTLSFSLIITP